MDNLADIMPEDWRQALREEFEKQYFRDLESFLRDEMTSEQVFPPRDQIFAAFRMTPLREVKVMLLGQDPYHDAGQAHGLCFSVPDGVRIPPSLRNMYKEMSADLNITVPDHGDLSHWAAQGILMLNTSLTVRAHSPGSHSGRGWEQFTDSVIRLVNASVHPTVFVLWGNHAAAKGKFIDTDRHGMIRSAHPSPLSASRGFFGSRPYSRINEYLISKGRDPIHWAPAQNQPELNLCP